MMKEAPIHNFWMDVHILVIFHGALLFTKEQAHSGFQD